MLDRITEQPFCQTRVSGSTFVNADCFTPKEVMDTVIDYINEKYPLNGTVRIN